MTATYFLAEEKDIEVLLKQPALLEWIEKNFRGFVGAAVIVLLYYNGHRFETQHLDRAVMLGPEIANSYREWRRKCIRAGVTEKVRNEVSNSMARLLVGQEQPIITKIEQRAKLSDARSVPMWQIRAMVARYITQANCPQVLDLWSRLSAHYGL